MTHLKSSTFNPEDLSPQNNRLTAESDSDETIIQSYKPNRKADYDPRIAPANNFKGWEGDSEETIIQSYKPRKKIDSEATVIQSRASRYEAIDDITLIRYFAKGETQLYSNQNLRMEYSCNAVQLITRRGELIGILKPEESYCPVLIKSNSEYWEKIHTVLLDSYFIPLGQSEQQQGFFEYKKYEVPEGYKINYTDARFLWKSWWPLQRNKNNYDVKYEIQLDFLIYHQEKIYPIQEILCHDGVFYVKTLIGEITLAHYDKVVWLEKIGRQISRGSQTNKPYLTSSKQSVEIERQPESDRAIVPADVEPSVVQNSPKVQSADVTLEQKLNQLKLKSLHTLAEYLDKGETEITTEILRNAQGEIVSTKVVKTQKSCPQWVLELLFNQNSG